MCDHVFELINNENICIHCLHSWQFPKDITSCCDSPDLEENDFLVCKNCGFGHEILNLVNDYETSKILGHKTHLCYKRLKYFRQKLSLMTVKTISDTSEINKVSKNIDIRACSSIQEIVEVLSKLKMRKFIKNAYEIYYIIHKIKVINLSAVDVYNLEKLFINFEKLVKQNRIKYLNNYNEVIYHLMNKLGLSGTEHILKPRTFKKNENTYKNILSLL